MATNILETRIIATDEASAKLALIVDQFGRSANTMQAAAAQVNAGMEPLVQQGARLETSYGRAARATRSLVFPLVNELSPALGSTATGIASAIANAALLSTGLVAVGIAAAGVAAVIGGRLVEAYQKATKAEEEFIAAVKAGDIPALEKQVAGLTKEIEDFATAREKASKGGRIVTGVGAEFGIEGLDTEAGGVSQQADIDERARQSARRRTAIEQAQLAKAVADSELDAARQGDLLDQARSDRAKRQADATQRQIDLEKAMTTAAIQAERQLAAAGADRLTSSAALLAAELARIAATRDADVKALNESAVLRRAAIERENADRVRAGGVSTAVTEQAGLTDTLALERRQIEEKFQADSVTAAARAAEEKRQIDEQLFSLKRQLGDASLQDELRRQRIAVRAADAGSKAQIEAMQRLAAAQSEAANNATGALDRLIEKQREIDRARGGRPAGEDPAAERERREQERRDVARAQRPRGISLVDIEEEQAAVRRRVERAESARERLFAGGNVSAQALEDLRNLSTLKTQADTTRDDLLRGLGGRAGARVGGGEPWEQMLFGGAGRARPENRAPITPRGLDTEGVPIFSNVSADKGLETVIQRVGEKGEPAFVVIGEKLGGKFWEGFNRNDAQLSMTADKIAQKLAELLTFQGARNGQ